MAPLIYIALVAAAQNTVFLLPFFDPSYEGGVQMILLFSVTLVSSILALKWPSLHPLHLFVIPVLLLGLELASLLVLLSRGILMQIEIDSLYALFDFIAYYNLLASVGIQTFFSAIIAVGLWMKAAGKLYKIRRAAHDLDEIESILSVIREQEGDEPLNLFQYQKLMRRSVSLVGSREDDVEAVIQALREGDLAILYDLSVSKRNEVENAAGELIESLLSRSEIYDPGIQIIAAVRPSARKVCADYEAARFIPIPNDSPQYDKIFAKLDTVNRWIGEEIRFFSKEDLLYILPPPKG